MFDEILEDIEKGKAQAKKIGPIILAVGGLTAVLSAVFVTGRSDDLQVVLYGLGGLICFVGGIVSFNGLRGLKAHKLYQQLSTAPTEIHRVTPTRIIRNGVHGTTRLEFFVKGASLETYELPKEQAQRWLGVLVRELPTLRVG